MSWAKFDDRYDDNRKVKRAWRKNKAAVALHAMAITYCCRHRTDGIVDADWVEEKLPVQRERDKTVTTLVAFGLFEEVDAEHWRIHDFLDYNPSKKAREDASDAARNAALARWSQEQDAARSADPHAERIAGGMRDPMPHPSRPDSSSAGSAREANLPRLILEAQRVFDEVAGRTDADEVSLANAHARTPGVDFIGLVRRVADELRTHPEKPTMRTLHRFIDNLKPPEPKVGRSKQQRQVDGIAAIQRVVGEEPA